MVGVDNIEVIGRNRLEHDVDDDVGVGHHEALRQVGDGVLLFAGEGLVADIGLRDGVGGIQAADHDSGALRRRGDRNAADSGDGHGRVVGPDGDVVAVLDVHVDAHVAGGHDEGVARELGVGAAVSMLDDHAVESGAGVHRQLNRDRHARRSAGDDLVVDVELHRADGGVDVAGELVVLDNRAVGLGGGAGARGGVFLLAGRVGGSGVAGDGLAHVVAVGDDGGERVVERLSGLDGGEVLAVHGLEDLLHAAVVDAVGSADVVGGLTGDDLVHHNRVAARADRRNADERKQQRVAVADLLPAGDVVDLHDEVSVAGEVHTEVVADAGNRLTGRHGVRNQVESDRIGRDLPGRGGRGRAGRGGRGRNGDRGAGRAGHANARHGLAAGDEDSVSVARRQRQHFADRQLVPLSVVDIVEDHDGLLAGVVVEAKPLADPQDEVALGHGILDRIRGQDGRCVCIGAEGHAREQGHDHQYGQQDTYEPFLHNCSP